MMPGSIFIEPGTNSYDVHVKQNGIYSFSVEGRSANGAQVTVSIGGVEIGTVALPQTSGSVDIAEIELESGNSVLTIAVSGNAEISRVVSALTGAGAEQLINYAHRDNGGRISAVQGSENSNPITSGAGTGNNLNDGLRIAGNQDGDDSGRRNRWQDTGTNPVWITITLAETIDVRRINVIGQQDSAEPINPIPGMTAGWGGFAPFTIQYWDGSRWANAASIPANTDLINTWEPENSITTDRIRLHFPVNVGQGWLRLVEIEVFGSKTAV